MLYKVTLENSPFNDRAMAYEDALCLVARYRGLFPSCNFRIVPA